MNIRTERNITGYLQADRNCNVQFYHAELGLINIVGGGGTNTFGWIDIIVDNERSNKERRLKISTIFYLWQRCLEELATSACQSLSARFPSDLS